MPAHMHLGAHPLTPGLNQNLFASIVCNKAMMAEPITSLIYSGALRRHPKLKIVSVESGVGWMAFMVPWMDNVYERHRHWQNLDLGDVPSTYFRRQVYGTFIEDPVGVRERHTIGIGNIMWSNDYPAQRQHVATLDGGHRRRTSRACPTTKSRCSSRRTRGGCTGCRL